MILDLETEIYSENSEKAEKLMKTCGELLRKYNDLYKLYELTGDICKISPYDKKFVDKYYEEAIKYFKDSILRSIIELKLEKSPKEFSSEQDYRVLFKITFDKERERGDMDSINSYNKVLNLIYNQRVQGCTDLSEAKILIQTLTRIKYKLSKMGMYTSSSNIDNEIKEVYNKLEHSEIFESLAEELELTHKEFIDNIKNGLKNTREMNLGFGVNN